VPDVQGAAERAVLDADGPGGIADPRGPVAGGVARAGESSGGVVIWSAQDRSVVVRGERGDRSFEELAA
jgi:hypothetical protein